MYVKDILLHDGNYRCVFITRICVSSSVSMIHTYLYCVIISQGALYGLIAGHVCGVTRMVLDFVYSAPLCGEVDTRPAILANLHYTYFSQINLLLTGIVIVIVSMITKPRSELEVINNLLILFVL